MLSFLKHPLFIIFLLGLLIVYFVMYGGKADSYSERQRLLYNETLSNTLNSSLNIEPDSYRDVIGEISELQHDHGPAIPWTFNEKRDPKSLPLSSLTWNEVFNLANEHDNPDACLELLRRKKPIFVSLFYHFYEYRFKKKYLEKAIALERPGALFLLKTWERYYQTPEFFQFSVESCRTDWFTNLEEYDDFRQLVLSGDFLLFETFLSFFHISDRLNRNDIIHSSLWEDVTKTLQDHSDQGDYISSKNLAKLIFYEKVEILDYLIGYIPYHKKEERNWIIQTLAKYIPIEAVRIKKLPELEPISQMLSLLEKAAQAGDLEAMKLWMSNRHLSLEAYSPDEWKHYFDYARQLAEAGDVEFLNELQTISQLDHHDTSYMSYDMINIIRYYYSQEALYALAESCRGQYQQNSPIAPPDYKLFINNEDYALNYLNEIKHQKPFFALYSLSELLSSSSSDWSFTKKNKPTDKKIIHLFLPIIQKFADEGDPAFMHQAISVFSSDKYGLKDQSKACLYFEKTWDIILREKSLNRTYYSNMLEAVFTYIPNIIQFYLDKTSTTYDEGKAATIIDQFYVLTSGKNVIYRQYAIFLFALKYDRGIGTKPDKLHAKKIYAQLKLDKHLFYYDFYMEQTKELFDSFGVDHDLLLKQ